MSLEKDSEVMWCEELYARNGTIVPADAMMPLAVGARVGCLVAWVAGLDACPPCRATDAKVAACCCARVAFVLLAE